MLVVPAQRCESCRGRGMASFPSLANGSKAKIRNLMHSIFNHAIRWEWHERNPITQVRQSAKRQRARLVLNIEQIRSLLEHL